jgi:hypothetical protein
MFCTAMRASALLTVFLPLRVAISMLLAVRVAVNADSFDQDTRLPLRRKSSRWLIMQ